MKNIKKIKFYFLTIILFSVAIISCTDDEVFPLDFSNNALLFQYLPSNFSEVIEVKGNKEWTYKATDIRSQSEPNWLTVVKKDGNLYVNVTKNESRTTTRIAEILVSTSIDEKVISVTQKQLIPFITADLVGVPNDGLTKDVGTFEVIVKSNINYDVEFDNSWITLESTIDGDEGIKSYSFSVLENTAELPREEIINFVDVEKEVSASVNIVQNGLQGERIPNSFITSATDDFHETDNPNAPGWGDGGIDFALDGNFNTKFHSKYDTPIYPNNPINLDVNFQGVDKMNYIKYYPRSGGGGAFTRVEIWYSSATQTTLTKLMEFTDFKQNSDPTKIIFPETINNIKTVRMRVFECKGNKNAACAELEFYYYK